MHLPRYAIPLFWFRDGSRYCLANLIAFLVTTSVGEDLEVNVVDVPDCPKISAFTLPYFFDENDILPPLELERRRWRTPLHRVKG